MKHWFKKIKNIFTFRKKTEDSSIDFLDLPQDAHSSWWGKFSIDGDQSRYVKIGNIVICIDHYNHEWYITSYNEGEKQPFSKNMGLHAVKGDLHLKPVLPDRSVLFSLEDALFLPANSSMTTYLSTPTWIRIEIGEPPFYLDEIPTQILSDTWYGKNSITGELCYYGNSFASISPENLPRDNTHVLTPVTLTNYSDEHILIKDLRIPAPLLTIFADVNNQLWSEKLITTFESDREFETEIIKGPPQGLNNPKQIVEPRFAIKTGLKSFFGARRN